MCVIQTHLLDGLAAVVAKNDAERHSRANIVNRCGPAARDRREPDGQTDEEHTVAQLSMAERRRRAGSLQLGSQARKEDIPAGEG